MFIISNALKNIRRYSRKSLLYFLVCVLTVLMLQVYMAVIGSTEEQLLRLPDIMPISARVANLDGSRYAGLQIQEKTVDGLLNSSYVRDLQLTVLLGGWIGESLDDYNKNQIGAVVGVNTIAVIEELDQNIITWMPDSGPDALFSSKAVCIADSGIMEAYGWSLGDSVSINMYYYRYGDRGEVYYEQLGTIEIFIIGMADLNAVSANLVSPRVIIPFEAIRAIFHEKDIAFTAASASFYVGDVRHLNDFKAEMKSLQLSSAPPAYDVSAQILANRGTALMVNDAAFISSATRLQETLSLLRGFLPLLAAALVIIGYFVAYLMIQSRREEYTVFRLLGLSKHENMRMYFIEITVLTLAGSLLGTTISVASGIGLFLMGLYVFLLFSLCFLLGGAIALLRLGSTNIMLALTLSD